MSTEKKYELVDRDSVTGLYRVRSLRAFGDVDVGVIGGWVASEANLSHSGSCWVGGNARVYGNALVSGNARVSANARVRGDAQVGGNARVSGGDAQVSGNALVFGDAWVFGDARVYGNARLFGDARVYGNALVFGDARVCGSARVYGNSQVSGNALVFGDAQVFGSMWIRYGLLSVVPDIQALLKCSIGVALVGGVVRLYKRVNADYSSEHDYSFVYPESGVVEAEADPDPHVSCGPGLHFSHVNYGQWIDEEGYIILAADIHVDDIISVSRGKVRCRRATIVGRIDD